MRRRRSRSTERRPGVKRTWTLLAAGAAVTTLVMVGMQGCSSVGQGQMRSRPSTATWSGPSGSSAPNYANAPELDLEGVTRESGQRASISRQSRARLGGRLRFGEEVAPGFAAVGAGDKAEPSPAAEPNVHGLMDLYRSSPHDPAIRSPVGDADGGRGFPYDAPIGADSGLAAAMAAEAELRLKVAELERQQNIAAVRPEPPTVFSTDELWVIERPAARQRLHRPIDDTPGCGSLVTQLP